jgi:hypothetical protein
LRISKEKLLWELEKSQENVVPYIDALNKVQNHSRRKKEGEESEQYCWEKMEKAGATTLSSSLLLFLPHSLFNFPLFSHSFTMLFIIKPISFSFPCPRTTCLHSSCLVCTRQQAKVISSHKFLAQTPLCWMSKNVCSFYYSIIYQ